MSVSLSSVTVESPIGPLVIRASSRGVCAVEFADAPGEDIPDAPPFLQNAALQLQEYFSGERTVFSDIPLAVTGTDFQQNVWDALGRIPFGETWTYAQIAAYVDTPGGAQAVGQALTRNPIPIIVPCHRVIPVSGETGGYAGGSQRKAWLLQHEHPENPGQQSEE